VKAIALDAYGGPEVLHPVDLPDPHPERGEIRIRVGAAAVAPVDAMLRTGLLAGPYEGLQPPFVPGMEVAGVVDELGPGIPADLDLPVGTHVAAFVDSNGAHGGYSDYVVVPAASATRAPKGATAAEAASFLNNSLTARNALDALALPAGSTLLVTGAAGSVGGYLTQLASHEGLRVIAIASAHDEALVRSFGAETVVPRGENAAHDVLALLPNGVDAAADAAVLSDQIVDTVRDGGQLAMFRPWDGKPGRGITVHFLNVRQRATDHDAITRLRDLVEEDVLTVRVGRVLPAAQAPEAHRLLDAGSQRGRIILEFPVS
jgi:NADPH2:quinone reductase